MSYVLGRLIMIFPIEITRELGIENNIPVDVDGFYGEPLFL